MRKDRECLESGQEHDKQRRTGGATGILDSITWTLTGALRGGGGRGHKLGQGRVRGPQQRNTQDREVDRVADSRLGIGSRTGA